MIQIFEECAMMEGLTLCEVAVGWTQGLFSLVVSDVGEVLSVLEVKGSGLEKEDDIIVVNLHLLIEGYLRGVGHPDDELVRAIVKPKDFAAGSKNGLLRSDAFVRAITGAPDLSVNGSLTVRLFVNDNGYQPTNGMKVYVNRYGASTSLADNPVAQFSTCSQIVNITLTPTLEGFIINLQQDRFDAWFHSQVWKNADWNEL
jgi:hypothetical protein